MKELVLMNYSRKIIMIAFLFLFVVSGLSGKKVIDITDITVKVVGWIKEYKGEDTNKLVFAAISFGLVFFLNPVEANFTDGLFNHLSSKAEGHVPTTSGIDKDTLDLLSQIIEEYER